MAKCVLFVAMIFLAFHSRYIAGKSLKKPKLKDHTIKKRSSYFLWQDTCPPPAFRSVAEVECKDTCHSNNDCHGNLLCCDNGCKTCMEPVLPPPVIDWLGSPSTYHRGFAAGGVPESNHIEVDLKEPHFEEVECAYKGKTFARGETFLKGCHKCHCGVGGISCEVGPCTIDVNPNQEEHSGESSGVDVSRLNPIQALELSGDDENGLHEYPTNTRRFESLTLHREGQEEVRVIPSTLDHKKTTGSGDEFESSGSNWEVFGEGSKLVGVFENLRTDVEKESGEGEHRNVLIVPTKPTETTDHSVHRDFIEKIKVRRLPKLRRRILQKQPKNDEELYENVLII